MPVFNFVTGEIDFRIAYFGPPFSGKTAALQYLQRKLAAADVSPLRMRPVGPDRMVEFDFRLETVPPGLPAPPRFHLFALHGSIVNPAARDRILTGLDGVALIADSRWEKIDDNVQALDALAAGLRRDGVHLEETPLVLHYNQRDLPNVAPVQYLDFVLNNRRPRRIAFPTNCVHGRNLFAALDALCKIVLAKGVQAVGHSSVAPYISRENGP